MLGHRRVTQGSGGLTGFSSSIEYDLHGLVGIRLVEVTRADALTVERQLGLGRISLNREPDIAIRFEQEAGSAAPLQLVGEDAGFNGDGFFVLTGSGRALKRVRIPFDGLGGPCQIHCQSGIRGVPFLIQAINLTMLGKGLLPFHASAFSFKGKGVLVTGWAKGGKTEALLAFMAMGADYIGDEWVFLSPDGPFAYGIPQPIRIWEWHLEALPAYRRLVGARARTRWRAIGAAERALGMIGRLVPDSGTRPGAADRAVSLLHRQRFVLLRPVELFGSRACSLAGPVQKLFFMTSQEGSRVRCTPIDPVDVVRRMGFSLRYERREFESMYLKYRYAFPGKPNQFIEGASAREEELLPKVLGDMQAYTVSHPYPAPIPALFDVMAPAIGN